MQFGCVLHNALLRLPVSRDPSNTIGPGGIATGRATRRAPSSVGNAARTQLASMQSQSIRLDQRLSNVSREATHPRATALVTAGTGREGDAALRRFPPSGAKSRRR